MDSQLEQHARPAAVMPRHASALAAATLCTLLLLVVGWIDRVTGKDISVTLLYLLPISAATWFLGRRAGLVFCIAAGACSAFVALSPPRVSLAAGIWNTGMRVGIFLAFWMLVYQLLLAERQRPNSGARVVSRLNRILTLSAAAAFALAACGWAIQLHNPLGAATPSASVLPTSPALAETHLALRDLASLVDRSMRASRPILIGSRDPSGPSCVKPIQRGELRQEYPTNMADYNGGPGTTMAILYGLDRGGAATSPVRDFMWHQNRLRLFLENMSAENAPAAQLADELAEKAQRLDANISKWNEIPADATASGFTNENNWPAYCFAQLDKAVAAHNLNEAKRWADEFAAASFALADLHRWLGLLAENHLLALRFQKQCAGLFNNAEAMLAQYDHESTISQFPAGVLSLNGWGNYYEVEHQAERLFCKPSKDDVAQLNGSLPAESRWVTPSLRYDFLKLAGALESPENKANWERAARAPYEHSYLTNMLYRAAQAGAVEDQFAALRKFDTLHPHASLGELMGVLMYRGHSFAGLEWSDRFQPQLLAAANQIPPELSDADALLAACKWTNRFYTTTPADYGVTFTLRDALEQKKLDCVRATDMIGAIFRNAGRPRFGHIRWCSETSGHSVAAYLGRDGDKPRILVADGLNPPAKPETFPDCYFHSHDWPPEMSHHLPPYAVELYVRGLDNYLWGQGYVIRGPNAGWLTVARLPYSTHWLAASSQKVFAGPYPN